MHDLIIFGAGGFGRETALMVQQINAHQPQWNLLGFYDDGIKRDVTVDDLKVLGNLHDLNDCPKDTAVAIAIADPQTRKKIRTFLGDRFTYPSLIHPSVQRGDLLRNHIGQGSILAAGTVLTTSIRIGDFVIVNLLCTIGHDVTIGNFASIMPSSSISGTVTVGQGVLIGTGARILPGLTIGENSKVGAGAVVTKNIQDNITVVGMPAKRLTK